MTTKILLAPLVLSSMMAISSNAIAITDNPEFGATRKLEILSALLISPKVAPAEKRHLERLVANDPARYIISSFSCSFINRSFRAECELVLAEGDAKGPKDVVKADILAYTDPVGLQSVTFTNLAP